MARMNRHFVSGAVTAACLFLFSGYALAGNRTVPAGQAAPADYLKVENALTRFAGTLARKRHLSRKAAFALLSGYLRRNPEIYGAAFAFVPEVEGGKFVKSSPYVYRSGGRLIEKDLIASYDYTHQKWYSVPAAAGKAVWSEPYFDKGGGEAWMKTYSIPIYSAGKNRRLVGVVTSDVLVPGRKP